MVRVRPMTSSECAAMPRETLGEVPTHGTVIGLHTKTNRVEFHFQEGLTMEETAWLHSRITGCKSFEAIFELVRGLAKETNQNCDMRFYDK